MAGKKANNDHPIMLKEYYGKYIQEVRGGKISTVKHYYDALNNISRRLKAKGLIEESIYEIVDLDQLKSVRDILYSDPDFISLDTRGQRMYSCGLNNYIRFASGEDFQKLKGKIQKMDVALEPEPPIIIEQQVWKRSNILRIQALTYADYKCEMDNSHETFITETTGKPYMEGHHAIPMRLQDKFEHSLDVYANLICLCPICHRRIHYGLKEDRVNMLQHIYHDRSERLATSGIKLSREEFIDIVISE